MGRASGLARGAAAGLCLLGLLFVGDKGAGAQGTPAMAAAPRIAVMPSGVSGALGPLINVPQTLNNCGPASIAEVLAYWGIWRTQGQVQAVLRVDGLERGMAPFGVPSYARTLGLRALVGVGGTQALIKALISNGFPVIVSQMVSVADPIGHYRPIEAYDDRQGVFIASDPYLGPNHAISYADFARIWTQRGEGFMVLYPPSRQSLLNAMLATVGWNKARAYQADLARLQARRWHGAPSQGFGGGLAPISGYRYLGLAWDEAQLGQATVARQSLRLATQQGANPVEVSWIAGEIGR